MGQIRVELDELVLIKVGLPGRAFELDVLDQDGSGALEEIFEDVLLIVFLAQDALFKIVRSEGITVLWSGLPTVWSV